ncbi:hypothetical protein C366_03324 [Cryptococcus neoformans Tu401-1]|nr:hypothetical protein C366_03324 [Cryptococcus neoformans var. grubii Tu401-1]
MTFAYVSGHSPAFSVMSEAILSSRTEATSLRLPQISSSSFSSIEWVTRATHPRSGRSPQPLASLRATLSDVPLSAKGSAEREDAKRKMARVSSHFDPDVSTLKASAYLRRRWMFVTSGHAMAGGLLPWKG